MKSWSFDFLRLFSISKTWSLSGLTIILFSRTHDIVNSSGCSINFTHFTPLLHFIYVSKKSWIPNIKLTRLKIKVTSNTISSIEEDMSWQYIRGCLYEIKHITKVRRQSHLSEVLFIPRLREKNIPPEWDTFHPS